jgi:chemotaxis methyl-accepting protein methylase
MSSRIFFTPGFDADTCENDLRQLLVPGILTDLNMWRGIDNLARMFSLYVDYYPYGLWAPGLSINGEMRSMSELYLPMAEIARVFDRFFALSLRFQPVKESSILHHSLSWLDFLSKMQHHLNQPDPAKLLLKFSVDEMERRRFIFANFLPASYGGGFRRYPGQHSFLTEWLRENRKRLSAGIRCLDAACGTGEGSYDIALLLMENGFAGKAIRIVAITMEAIELFAAAHAFFPHDPGREKLFRSRIKLLVDYGITEKISFRLERLEEVPSGENNFDVILCNGILGGPFIHDPEKLSIAVRSLARRLAKGGIMLAADRFHQGWKKKVNEETIRREFTACGLRSLPVTEGAGGERA